MNFDANVVGSNNGASICIQPQDEQVQLMCHQIIHTLHAYSSVSNAQKTLAENEVGCNALS